MSRKKQSAVDRRNQQWVRAFIIVALALIASVFVLGYRETQQHRQDVLHAQCGCFDCDCVK